MTLTGTLRKAFATTLAAAVLVGTLAGCSSNANSNASPNAKNSSDSSQTSATEIKRGESHDPSIVKANGKYYIFGSHLAWLKSDDLVNWTSFKNNLSTDYEKIFADIWTNWSKQSANPDVKGNMWAPDVIWNATMKKWCMYMSINGANYRSAIVLLTADDIEGDWTYVGPVTYSGFEKVNASKTDVWKVLGEGADLTRYTSQTDTGINAIDPCVKQGDNGDLWMTFGSWFGGMWMFKLDPKTGLRDYSTTYQTVKNQSDAYYGIKLGGGFGNSGEGSYLLHTNGHWYLFASYGNLQQTGGYQVRMFRADKITGPYIDENGNAAVSERAIGNNWQSEVGVRLMSSIQWSGNDNSHIEVAQGHNSAFVDDDGTTYIVYHSRFSDTGEMHQVRVRELLPTADGWLTAAPYEYRGAAAVPPTAANTSDPTVGDDDDGFDDYIVAPSSAPNLAARLCHCVHPVHESDLAHPSLVSGDYEFVRHDPHAYFNGTRNADGTWHGVNLPETITLQPDGRVTSGGVVDFFDTPDANLPRSTDGPVSRGSWRMLGATPAGVHCCDSDMAITIDGMTYTGVFAVLPRETDGRATLTFSAIGGNQAIWGARIEG